MLSLNLVGAKIGMRPPVIDRSRILWRTAKITSQKKMTTIHSRNQFILFQDCKWSRTRRQTNDTCTGFPTFMLTFSLSHFLVLTFLLTAPKYANMIARLSAIIVTIALLCTSAAAVDKDEQVAFYLRGSEERNLLEDVSTCLIVVCYPTLNRLLTSHLIAYIFTFWIAPLQRRSWKKMQFSGRDRWTDTNLSHWRRADWTRMRIRCP